MFCFLQATDLDEGNNSAILYSLSQGDTNTLNIDPWSGELRCVRDLAKTLTNQLSVVVNATDNLGQGYSVQVSVTVRTFIVCLYKDGKNVVSACASLFWFSECSCSGILYFQMTYFVLMMIGILF